MCKNNSYQLVFHSKKIANIFINRGKNKVINFFHSNNINNFKKEGIYI